MQIDPMGDNGAMQVRLKLEDDSWHGAGSEGVWTKLMKPLADKVRGIEIGDYPDAKIVIDGKTGRLIFR